VEECRVTSDEFGEEVLNLFDLLTFWPFHLPLFTFHYSPVTCHEPPFDRPFGHEHFGRELSAERLKAEWLTAGEPRFTPLMNRAERH
jgi:hypothetical protein